ncbi:MAG: MerC domain-containing protein [Pirellulaceae bacterium]|nr:MerC domain-containing protein [Pirellulaceae bacterium]
MEERIISREQAITARPLEGRLDWFGVLCSFGCAVHCAAMPVLVATLPSLTSLRWLADPLFHQAVAVLCAVLVSRAIVPGYSKHRDSRVITLAGLGLSLLFVAAFILPDACCSKASSLPTGSERLSAKTVSQNGTIRLVSVTSSSTPAKLTGLQDNSEVGNCPHSATLSRPLLTAWELEGQLGPTTAQALIHAQPFLSPIGGLFLIFAHVMNIRLRCCRRAPCKG